MNSINILVEAKKEYTNQLQKILTPRLYEGFKSIYDDIINLLSKELEENKVQGSSTIKTFQKSLKEIPQWNQDMIKNEYNRIEKLSNCDYFDNLVEAVFITNTKILTSVQINDNKPLNIKINIPQASYFIHKCYMESAKEIYKNPYIFDQSKNILPKEKHNNLREAINIIDNSINNAIRDLLPIRDILLQGLTKNTNEILQEVVNKEENTELTSNEVNENSDEDEEDENEEDGEDNNEGINEDINEEDNQHNSEDKHQAVSEEIILKNIEENKEVVQENNEVVNNEILIIDKNDNISELSEDVHVENSKSIILSIVPQEDKNNIVETKEIFYNKITPTITKKLSSIEKISENKLSEQKQPISSPEAREEYSELYPRKIVESKKSDIQSGGHNPFIKNIPQKIFLKNKHTGSDKNNSFYKKKYEENSANYNSISDNLKENDTFNTVNSVKSIKEVIPIKSIKEVVSTNPIKEVTKESIKHELTKEKNKIILDGGSSDEEENDDEIDI
jgi:hypothetical protein